MTATTEPLGLTYPELNRVLDEPGNIAFLGDAEVRAIVRELHGTAPAHLLIAMSRQYGARRLALADIARRELTGAEREQDPATRDHLTRHLDVPDRDRLWHQLRDAVAADDRDAIRVVLDALTGVR